MLKLFLFLISGLLSLGAMSTCKGDRNSVSSDCEASATSRLCRYEWKVDEVRRNIAGENSSYVRGGKNNTGVSYDRLRMKFAEDGTGAYTDENGTVHTTQWKFTSSDERNMQIRIGPPYATTYQWHLVEVSANALHNSTFVNNDILVSARYTPVR